MQKHRWFERYRDLVRASKLQRLAAAGLVVLALITVAQSNLFVIFQNQLDQMLSAVLPGTIVNLTNDERVTHALGTLTRSKTLDEAARLKALDMRSHQYFAHWSPEGTSPWFWFDQAGYDYAHAGENLAIYFTESTDVIEAWMESPLHRENILRSEYTEIGVAAVEGTYNGHDTIFVVQLFGTPASGKVVIEDTTPLSVHDATSTIEAPRATTSGPTTNVLAVIEPPAPAIPIAIEKIVHEEPLPTLPSESTTTDASTTPQQETLTDVGSTTISAVPVGTSVAYVSDHASTSNLNNVAAPASLSYQTPESIHAPRLSADEARTTLQTLYILLALIVGGLIVASIYYAERHLHHTQAAFGASLLGITLALVSVHVYLAQAVYAAL